MLDRYSIQELSQTILQFWLLQVVTTFTMFRFPELDRSRVWIRSLAAILFGLQIETKEVSAKICKSIVNLVPAIRSIKSPFTLPESSHEQWWSWCFENSFGWRLQYLTSKHTCPTAQVSTEKPLQEELASSGWSSWDESALGPCLRYVWGSSLKAVPQGWKAYDNEAKLNFPLGEYRGFTYLWASVVKHIQTLRMFF